MSDKDQERALEIWKTVIEVQKHFNDIGMRIRSMFVTILLGFFAAMGFLIDRNLTLEYGGVSIQYAIIVAVIGIYAAWLFYFIDRYWYHRLLVGSVNHAVTIEKKFRDTIPELALSEAIGEVSPYEPKWPISWWACLIVRHKKYRDTGKLHSDGKIELFYKSVMSVMVIAILVLSLTGGIGLGNIATKDESPTKAENTE